MENAKAPTIDNTDAIGFINATSKGQPARARTRYVGTLLQVHRSRTPQPPDAKPIAAAQRLDGRAAASDVDDSQTAPACYQNGQTGRPFLGATRCRPATCRRLLQRRLYRAVARPARLLVPPCRCCRQAGHACLARLMQYRSPKTKKADRSVCRERDGRAPGIRHLGNWQLGIGNTTMTTLLDDFRSNYSATQNEEMSLEDYLDLCKRQPAAYATAAERMLAGIGEPELVDTRNDSRLSRIFGNRVIRRYPGVRRVLRHGGRDRADRRLLQACGAGSRGEEADPLPAGSGRRRQVVDRRAAQGGDGKASPSTRSRARRSTNRRSVCSRPSASAPCWRRTTAFRAAI